LVNKKRRNKIKTLTLTDKHMKDPIIRREVINYFSTRFIIDNPPRAPIFPISTGCWKWTAGKKGQYGDMTLNRKKLGVIYKKAAHIVSYMIYMGPTNGKLVTHNCQEGLCVNPDHLRLGDAKSNAHDALMNRLTVPPTNRSCKLTTPDAIRIRILHFQYNYSCSSLAKMYDVCYTTVSDVINYKTFKI